MAEAHLTIEIPECFVRVVEPVRKGRKASLGPQLRLQLNSKLRRTIEPTSSCFLIHAFYQALIDEHSECFARGIKLQSCSLRELLRCHGQLQLKQNPLPSLPLLQPVIRFAIQYRVD